MSRQAGTAPAATASTQLGYLLARVRDLLGSDLVGAYLHGSAVLGGQLPTSDLDLLVVCGSRITTDQRRRLAGDLLTLSVPPSDERHGRDDARPIELTIVRQSAVRPWRFPPEIEFQYGDWLRDAIAAGTLPVPARNADLAVLIEVARRGNAALAGPPPADVFEAVPWRDLVAAMTRGLGHLLDDVESDTRNVLLTLCRIWMTLETAEIRRKDEAAIWASERLPSRLGQVIHRARAMYLAGEYGPWGDLDEDARPTAEHIARLVDPRAR